MMIPIRNAEKVDTSFETDYFGNRADDIGQDKKVQYWGTKKIYSVYPDSDEGRYLKIEKRIFPTEKQKWEHRQKNNNEFVRADHYYV